jgi:hypothetical protein
MGPKWQFHLLGGFEARRGTLRITRFRTKKDLRIPTLRESLEQGAVVVIEAHRIRLRSLPISGGE